MVCNLSYQHHLNKIARYLIPVLMAYCFLLPQEVFATHIVGGQMTYECLGNNRYRVTVEMRRDCFEGADDAQFDDPMSIGIYDGAGNLRLDLGLNGQLFVPFNGDDTLNEILTSECQVLGEDVCVHTTTYSTVVTLPLNMNGYYLVYQRCCRNQFLANIVQPLNTGATWYVQITPAAMETCNSSPKFKDWPQIYLCTNDEVQFDHSATDADGDSLVYFLCRPTAGANRLFPKPQPPSAPPYPLITYIQGFDAEHPMGAEAFSLDTETGLLTVLPTLQSQYLIGVCVDEYRNGVFMGRTRRDFEYNVRICIDDPMSAFEVFPDDTICNSLEVSFQNNSMNGLELNYQWFFDYPNPDITSNEFSPTHTYEKPGLYEVVLVSSFGDCMDTSRLFVGVSLEGDPLVDFDLLVEDCTENIDIQLTDLTQTEQEITSWEWEISYNGQNLLFSEQNPSFSIAEGVDSLLVRLQVDTESGCTGEKEMVFKVGIIEFELIGDTTICNGDSIQLVSFTMDGLTYEWSPDTSLDLSDPANPIAFPSETTTYTVFVSLGMCTMEYMITVNVENEKDIFISIVGDEDDFVCLDSVQVMHNYEVGEVEWFADSLFIQSLGISNPLTLTGIPLEGQTVYALLLNDVCESSASLEILRKDFDAVLDFPGLICEGDTIRPSLSIDNGDYEYSYDWQPADLLIGRGDTSMPAFYFEEAGSYEIFYSVNNQFGCSDSGSISFNVQALPVLDLVNDEMLQCEGDSIDLNPNGDPSYNYLWNSINSDVLVNDTSVNPRVSVDDTTQFEVVVTTDDIYECSITDTVTIFRAPGISLELITMDQIVCPGSSIALEASTGVDAQLQWFDEDGILIGEGDSVVVFPDTSMMYTVIATDAQNCMDEATVFIEVSPDINLQLSDDALEVCFTTTVTLFAFADTPVNFTWTDGSGEILSTTDSLVLTAVSDSLITVTATDVNGCTESAQIGVNTEGEIGLMVEAPDTITCFGETVTFIATSGSGTMIQWFDAADQLVGEGNELTVTADTTTSFHIVASNELGCMEDITIIFEVSPDIGLTASADTTVCYETEVTLLAFTGSGISVEWKNQQGMVLSTEHTFNLFATQDSLLTVFATDINGCMESENVFVSTYDDLNLQVETPPSPVCFEQRTFINAETDVDATIEWYDSSGTILLDVGPFIVISLDTTTSFYVKATDQFGCMDDTTVTVEVYPEIIFSRTPDTLACYGQEVTLVAKSPISPLSYAWLDENNTLLSTDSTVSITPFMDRVIRLILINTDGCSVMDDVVITVTEEIGLMVDAPMTHSCFGDTITFTATASGSGTQIEWFNAFEELIGTGPEIQVSADSTTSYSVVATDNYGCIEDTSFVFQVAPEIIFVRTPDTTICMMEEIVLTATGSGSGMLTFEWFDLEGQLLSDADTVLIIPMDTTQVVVVASDEFGCTASDTANIMISPPINLSAGEENFKYCEGESKTLTVTTKLGTMIIWYGANNNILAIGPSITVNPMGDMPITVVASDQYGCEERIDTVLTPYSLDLVGFTEDVLICEDEQTVLSVTNNDPLQTFTYLWTPVESIVSDNMMAQVTVQPDTTTEYTVFLTNQDGCMFDTTVTVTVSFIPEDIVITANPEQICLGQTTQLSVVFNPDYTYSWTPAEIMDNPNIFNPVAMPVDEFTDIMVVVTNPDGCTKEDVLTFFTEQPLCTEEDIFVPNMFTPNGDGVNDVFQIESNYIDELFLIIYNRWGQKVFETRDPMGVWDGTHNNEPLGTGVFGYYVEVICLNQFEYTSKGSVTLLR